MDGTKKEGVSVLEKINSSKRNDPFADESAPTQGSGQTIVLTILAVAAIIAVITLFLGGGITGAAIGITGSNTAPGGVLIQNTGSTTGSSVGNIADSGINDDANPDGTTVTEAKQNAADSDQVSNPSASSGSNTVLLKAETDRTEAPISLSLDFSQIPSLDATVSLSSIELNADNLGSSVRINGDLLEANSEVTLELSNYFGRFSLNEHSTTLIGTVSQIHLNGVSLLSDQEITIEIDALQYDHIQTDQISFSYLYLEPGSGTLELEDLLTYKLQDNTLDFYDFLGQMTINPGDSLPFSLSGEAESLESSSSILQLAVE